MGEEEEEEKKKRRRIEEQRLKGLKQNSRDLTRDRLVVSVCDPPLGLLS